MTDQELVSLIKKNASEGIAAALDLYGGSVKTICCSFLNGFQSEDIEEAVSDVFVELWRSINRYKADESNELKYFLYGIARNVAANKRRKLMKDRLNTEEIDQDIADHQNVEEQVVKDWEEEILSQLINELKSPDREIFIARYYEQMQVKEIASKYDLTTKSVENRLSRGKERLRKRLIAKGVVV